MFLFTTPPATRETAAPPASPVVDAIRQGAHRTGARFDYLLATAQRESALNPEAKAPTSSASGLFQFIEQTWLGVVRSDGEKAGLGAHAKAIRAGADGALTVDDPATRKAILDLRKDPEVASVMAGALTQRNRETLMAELGREPGAGELYTAHFLGAKGAAELIKTAQSDPTKPAAAAFPDAAASNRSIFYDRSGRPRGAGEVYALLAANQPGPSAAPAFAPDRPVAFARADGPAFHGMFQSEGRRGPISEAVAKLWRTNADAGTRTAAVGGFFPRSDAASPAAPAEPPVAAVSPAPRPALADVPLPPPRPAGLGVPDAPRRQAGQPLDLSQFMRWRRT